MSDSSMTIGRSPHRIATALFAAAMAFGTLSHGGEAVAQSARASIGGSCPSMTDVSPGMSIDELIRLCPPVSCGNIRTVSSLRASIGPAPESEAATILANEQCSGGAASGGTGAGTPTEAPRPPSNPIAPPAIQSSRVIIERGYTQPNPGVNRSTCAPYYRAEGTITNGQIVFTSGGHTWRGEIYPNSYISIDRNGVTPRPRNPTAITGPSDNAVMYNGYCGRGFFRIVPDGASSAPVQQVQPVQPSLLIPNGVYIGARGYTDADRRSPNNECLGYYEFEVTVRDGGITYRSDGRTWRGSIDQSSGYISFNGSNASPPTNSHFSISGDAYSASMSSAYCGNGYFHIDH